MDALAGYEDVNDAERLGRDPAMRWIVGGKAVERGGASTSQMGRFETELLANDENLAALADLSGVWIDRVHARKLPRMIVLDMDSSVSPTHGDQEGTAYNGHFCGTACKVDGVDASSRRHRSVPRWWRDQPPEEEASMEQVNIIGIDLAKRSFQLHGARADGSVAFRRKVSRERLLYILGAQQRCVVAMEACASAHYWGREILKLGHEVRLVPPIYVKPFVKRQKNDAADAEAICEAAQRPTMRFVAVKGEEQQARAMLFHTRDLLVRQRTQTINALRGHLAEFGVIAPQGVAHVGRLASALEDPGSGLPGAVRALGGVLLGQIADLDAKIGGLEKELRACARQDEQAARLMTIPGIGPINAMALQAFAPPMESFRRGRDFSAWLGLVPRQHTTGGKPRLGRISKMGQRDLRRLLIIGAMAVVSSAVRRGETNDPWLARMLARKPRMLVAVALANKMARIVWALMTRKETYRGFAPAAA